MAKRCSEVKKPNGKNAPRGWQRDAQKSKNQMVKMPQEDGKEMLRSQSQMEWMPQTWFPIPLDLWPCPRCALQKELPFTGRTPPVEIKVLQIGTKVPQIGTKFPQKRQGQRGPGVHSMRLTKLLAAGLQCTKGTLSNPPKVNVFSE